MRTKSFLILLPALLLCSCAYKNYDFLQILVHEDANARTEQSLAMAPPASLNLTNTVFSFAVFSDLHFGYADADHIDWFKSTVATNNILFFIVTGDITENGAPSQWAHAEERLDSVGIPYYCTMGNHDLYNADGWEQFKAIYGPSVYTATIKSDLRLIFLDSANGAFGTKQFDWLQSTLENNDMNTTFICTHFPVQDGSYPGIFHLANSEERMKLISMCRNYGVDYYVSGHIHAYDYVKVGSVSYFTIGTMNDKLDYSSSHGYLLFTYDNGAVTWEHITED